MCYWYAGIRTDLGVDKKVVLSFDMSDELFHEISFPESTSFHERLAVWKESIVLVSYKDDDPEFLDIWVMDESGGFKGSWTKNLTIGPVQGLIPLAFWKREGDSYGYC